MTARQDQKIGLIGSIYRQNWNVKWRFRQDLLSFFGVKEFFSWILISKMDGKIDLRIITKIQVADSKIGPLKIDFWADWTHESIPTAWELSKNNILYVVLRDFMCLTQDEFKKLVKSNSTLKLYNIMNLITARFQFEKNKSLV